MLDVKVMGVVIYCIYWEIEKFVFLEKGSERELRKY